LEGLGLGGTRVCSGIGWTAVEDGTFVIEFLMKVGKLVGVAGLSTV